MTASTLTKPSAPDAPETRGVDVLTFGCRLNAYESEVMRRHAEDAGLDNLVVVNTCAVTREAVRQARQAIRKARKDNPRARIVVTGCAAQTDPAHFAEMVEVDDVIGNDEKMRGETFRGLTNRPLATAPEEKVRVGDIMSVRETAPHLIDGFGDRARAFVQVQNGCDHRCTFCIIPYGRGNSRSVPAGEVVTQIRALVEQGYREVVLTGVDLTSYGPDLPVKSSLGRLVGQILRGVPDLERLRISSIDSVEVDDALFRLMAEHERVMPHLHLSLQAGDNMILKRMKRRHSREDAIAFCERLRAARPDVVFGADLIAGFPTETEAMFENTLDIVEACGLTYLHVFPYSARPGTPAARMPQVHGTAIKERAGRLRAAGEQALSRYLSTRIGLRERVLVEKDHVGRTEGFALVRLDRPCTPGRVVDVHIEAVEGGRLIGRVEEAGA